MRLMSLLCLSLLVMDGAFESRCLLGYTQTRRGCEDENECDEENPRCGLKSFCINTPGSYYCQCELGYQTKSKKTNFTNEKCRDINECYDTTICGDNAECSNNPGSYYCTCAVGFKSSNGMEVFNTNMRVTCKDIDECEDKTICGSNAACINTNGSFNCTCASGFRPSNGQQFFKANKGVSCDDVCVNGPSLCGEGGVCQRAENAHECVCKEGFTNFGLKNMSCKKLECDIPLVDNFIAQTPGQFKQILSTLQYSCESLKQIETAGFSSLRTKMDGESLITMLLEAIDVLLSVDTINTNQKVTAFLEIVEKALKLIGPLLKRHVNISTNYTKLKTLVSRGMDFQPTPLIMSTNNIQLESHWEIVAGDEYLGFATATLLCYYGLENSINDYLAWIDSEENQKFQINSEVVTISVTNPNTTHLKKPVTLTFSHLQPAEGNLSCVYWNSALNGGAWSSNGCTLVRSNTSHTVCSCTHLSSFAVLMALYEQENVFELQLITWIGLSFSLVCFLICILAFHFVHAIKSTRTTIHLHFCISFFIADLIFLAGISQTENKVGCAVVAGMLHFFFLAVFCWMLMEGLQLFRMVVFVFNTSVNHCYLITAGYGTPALIVAISAIINAKGYGTKQHCWLNLENGFIWSFFGPVCLIITVNVFFFLITVWKLAQKFSSLNPDLSKLRKLKTFTITATAQLCVLGTTWIFGCFQFDKDMLFMSYLFTILNSLQGVLVFILHCLLSKQVREAYANILSSMSSPQKRKYNEFGTNRSSKSQSSKSAQNTGESQI